MKTKLLLFALLAVSTFTLSAQFYEQGHGSRLAGNPISIGLRVWGPLIVFTNLAESNITDDSADISWDTDTSVACDVSFGLTAACEAGSDTEPLAVLNHLATLSSLTPSTHYYYCIHCETVDRYGDASGEFDTLAMPVAVTPSAVPVGGIYGAAQNVTLSTTTPGATIYYTIDGSTPTISSSVYSSAIYVGSTTTLQAIAVAAGYANSAVMSEVYTINLPVAATPTATPGGGSYTSAQSVTLSTTTPGAAIHYTIDGLTPTVSSPTYSSALSISVTTTVQAIAIVAGYQDSAVMTETYTINFPDAAEPTASPLGGTYTSAQSVTLSTTTPGATIYYTTDGTAPTPFSNVYSGAIPISTTTTLRAMAVAAGYDNSPVMTQVYTINLPSQVATPISSPAAGIYTSAQAVTLSTTTPGATIYYTTDGTTPTIASPVYTGPISVTSTMTIKAFATAPALADSGVMTVTFTITTGSGGDDDNDDQGGRKKKKSSVMVPGTGGQFPGGEVVTPPVGPTITFPKPVESRVGMESFTFDDNLSRLFKDLHRWLNDYAVAMFIWSNILLIIAIILLLARAEIIGRSEYDSEIGGQGIWHGRDRWVNFILIIILVLGFILSIITTMLLTMLITVVLTLTFAFLEYVRYLINRRHTEHRD